MANTDEMSAKDIVKAEAALTRAAQKISGAQTPEELRDYIEKAHTNLEALPDEIRGTGKGIESEN